MSRAEPLLVQAMATRSLARGDEDVTDAQILNNLGAIYQKQRKYAKAEESYKRSLEITERRLGPVHPYLAWTHGNLAELYTEMRRYKETEDQYRHSLSIFEQMSPVPNARIAQTLYRLGQNYLKQGDKARTESALARAVEIARRNPQPILEMPALLDAHADILKSLGKTQESPTPVRGSSANAPRNGFDGSRVEAEIASARNFETTSEHLETMAYFLSADVCRAFRYSASPPTSKSRCIESGNFGKRAWRPLWWISPAARSI